MGEKTEKASPKKLRDAREKGQVAKSQDFPSAFTFMTSIVVVLGTIHFLYGHIGSFITTAFSAVGQSTTYINEIETLFESALYEILVMSLPACLAVAFIGVLVNFLTVGPVFTFEVFKPDIKKFDMIQNLKQKFKMKTFVELLKQLFKVFVAGYIVYGVMMESIPTLVKTVHVNLITSLYIFNTFLIQVVIKVGLFFIAVAVFDLFFQKAQFAKEMKMEKFELKQEYKNSEGDPQIKGKRRQIAQEIAYGEGPEPAVKQAQAVVTNPTHLAVAIGYTRGLDIAPYILTKGDGDLAKQIIYFANKHNVPIVRNIPLAHELWDKGELYEYIPEETFEAMSEILRWVASLNHEREESKSEVEL